MTHRKPRIMLYSHDTYGLGHLRRTLSIAEQLSRDISNVHQLVLTGSMVAGAFSLPPRLDLVKLPALSKRSSGEYKARALPLSLRQTLAWREQMIVQATRAFQPHLVVVDKVAGGVHGELLPALRYLKTWCPETKFVLGMRDIEDSRETTRAEWQASGAFDLFETVYDAILFYGQREVFDPVTAYGLSSRVASKLVPCGYLRRTEMERSPAAVRRELGCGETPLVLVTVGGGGDGYAVLKTYLEMLLDQGDQTAYHSLLVTGPLMAESKRQLVRRAARAHNVTVMEFTRDLLAYMAAADLVVSMAGYNTVCELMSLGKRTLLVPRQHVRAEQRMRAEALAERGLVHVLDPAELDASRLQAAIKHALAAPPPLVDLDLDGLQRASQAIAALLSAGAREDGAARNGRLKPVASQRALSTNSSGLPAVRP